MRLSRYAVAPLLLLAPIFSKAQNGSVPQNFGSQPKDAVFTYGFQYQSLPRRFISASDVDLLPASLSYNLNPRFVARVDVTTLKSVQYPSKPRATGVGDMDGDIAFVAASETLTAPQVTIDYQLNFPTGNSNLKLGTGEVGHRFNTTFSKGRNSWRYQFSFGDLFTRKSDSYDYSNTFFGALAVAYTFPKKDLVNAVPMIKSEIDFIPAYSSVPRIYSTSNPNLRSPTEVYDVSTFNLPLKWASKLNLVARVGITPFTPKFVVSAQFQHLFRSAR